MVGLPLGRVESGEPNSNAMLARRGNPLFEEGWDLACGASRVCILGTALLNMLLIFLGAFGRSDEVRRSIGAVCSSHMGL
jgi:hypothetical protein